MYPPPIALMLVTFWADTPLVVLPTVRLLPELGSGGSNAAVLVL